MFRISRFLRAVTVAFAMGAVSDALAADEGTWSVGKSSGEVWMTTTGVQQASLKQDEVLKPGDTIRTGRNGRVLLVRGEETILMSPNSVIGLPTEKKDGLSTTIVQQAGSILLEVEKRNVQHFEVETPYLAAVVKGTQFSVSVNGASTSVDVLRGQVEVADFKSGQIAQVMPGQAVTAFAHGKFGLSLSGSGTFNPIEQGKPRSPSIERITVPKAGLSAPRGAANGQLIRALMPTDKAAARTKTGAASLQPTAGNGSVKNGLTRISSSLGEVRLNFNKVTHGLARGSVATPGLARNAGNRLTVWNSHDGGGATGNTNNPGQGSANEVAGSIVNAPTSVNATTASGGAAPAAAIIAAGGNSGGGGGGNGNTNTNSNGNGNGHGKGNGNDDDNEHGHRHGHGHGHGHGD